MQNVSVRASGCTGNADLDTLLERSNLAEAAGLNGAGSVYTWQGLCDAIKTAKSVGYTMFEGTGPYSVAQAASNIASLLAQCKWESGLWTACDENWWNTASPQGACSQRPDNSLYHELTGPDDDSRAARPFLWPHRVVARLRMWQGPMEHALQVESF